jgi:sugar lactone lactonase YvrE
MNGTRTRARITRSMLAVGAVTLFLAGQAASATSAGAAIDPVARATPIAFSNDVYVTDNSAFGANNGGLIHVAPGNGTRTSLSENNNPVGGPNFETPWGMTLDANGDLLVAEQAIVGNASPAVIKVDRTTGVRTLVSDNVTPAGGPSLSSPSGIAVESDGNILIADMTAFAQGNGGVIRVDPVTGARTTVSRNGAPAGGPSFNGPMDLAVAKNGDIYLANTFGTNVIKVDPLTGVRTLVSRNGNPAGGPAFSWPWGMTIAPDGDILISDSNAFGGPGGIIRVNPATGVRSTVSSNAAPAGGPLFSHPGDLVVESCGDVLVTDSGTDSVYRVDLATGTRTLVSDNTSPGTPNFAWPHGIAATSTITCTVLEPPFQGPGD